METGQKMGYSCKTLQWPRLKAQKNWKGHGIRGLAVTSHLLVISESVSIQSHHSEIWNFSRMRTITINMLAWIRERPWDYNCRQRTTDDWGMQSGKYNTWKNIAIGDWIPMVSPENINTTNMKHTKNLSLSFSIYNLSLYINMCVCMRVTTTNEKTGHEF